jgi:hypothetical protein
MGWLFTDAEATILVVDAEIAVQTCRPLEHHPQMPWSSENQISTAKQTITIIIMGPALEILISESEYGYHGMVPAHLEGLRPLTVWE